MSEQQLSIEDQQRQESQRREDALRQQTELSEKLVDEQMQTQQELSKEAMQAQHDHYEIWLKNETGEHNQLMPAVPSRLPTAPREPLPMTGTTQEKAHGKQALEAYKQTGFVSTGHGVPAVSGPQATGGDQALAEEKAFRERQQHLADRITDPNTSHEQRERLELLKATEYHDYKATQWENVGGLQQQLGYPEKSVQEAFTQRDHHQEQSALVANKLHEHDQKMGTEPKEVAGKIAELQLQHKEKAKNEQSDPHLEMLASDKSEKHVSQTIEHREAKKTANPALERLQQRKEKALQAHNGEPPNEYIQGQVAEAKVREQQIESAQVEQRNNVLGHKAEAERQAAHGR